MEQLWINLPRWFSTPVLDWCNNMLRAGTLQPVITREEGLYDEYASVDTLRFRRQLAWRAFLELLHDLRTTEFYQEHMAHFPLRDLVNDNPVCL